MSGRRAVATVERDAWTRLPTVRADPRSLAPVALSLTLAAGCTGGLWESPDGATGQPQPSERPSPSPSGRRRRDRSDRRAGRAREPHRVRCRRNGSGRPRRIDPGRDLRAAADVVAGRRQHRLGPTRRRRDVRRCRDGGGDGTRPTETPVAAAPFYLSWDPTSSRVAYLGSSAAADIELGIVDVAGSRAVPVTPAALSTSRGTPRASSCSCTWGGIASTGSRSTARSPRSTIVRGPSALRLDLERTDLRLRVARPEGATARRRTTSTRIGVRPWCGSTERSPSS